MRASLARRGAMTVAVVAALALAGCAASPATRFYVLTPVEVDGAAPSLPSDAMTIGVRSVDLPEALDRPQIMTRTGPNTVDGELGGPCVLRARWRVLGRRGGPPAVYGESTFSDAAGPDYAALVATESRLLGALTADIAAALRNERAEASGPHVRAIPAHE